MLKGSILQKDIIILNVYSPNNIVSNNIRGKNNLQGEIDKITIIKTSTPLPEKWMVPANTKLVRTYLNSTTPSINYI